MSDASRREERRGPVPDPGGDADDLTETADPGDEAQAAHPRHVDPETAQVGGSVGAAQQVSGAPTGEPPPAEVEHRRADAAVYGQGADGASGATYYDQPAIKEPVWIWSVPAYLYTGGAAAGAALLGAAAQAADRDGHDALIRRCRDLAAAGAVASTGLLIHDLGRPARFLNMLRVFRPSSAMSVGSWTLAAFGGLSGAAAALPRLGLRRLGDAAGLGAGALAPALGTYTGVLLADTAVPVWQAARRELPALFAASGLASSAALIQVLGPHDERSQAIAHRLGAVGLAGELAAGQAVARRTGEIASVGRPLREGASGTMWRAAEVSTAASLGLSLLPGHRRSRWRRRLAGLLATAGAVTMRFALFQAGKASARSPRATFDQQRAAAQHGPR